MPYPAVSDLCSSGVWACEDDKIFKGEGLLPAKYDVLAKDMNVKDWTYAIKNVLAGYWDTKQRWGRCRFLHSVD